ncbi:MAG: tRNA uridine-5-carboxymethylaminomethyl(34) synthesis GTPase MnmE [Planctomycetes bacterium]|nr:tRNA uridine-5-carboxymethylaminomethyl(34) synthesis GTPase MnmE [Planctomycetota bacterium]
MSGPAEAGRTAPGDPASASARAGDTIVALSSPPGASFLAVVRLSGPDAFRHASSVLRLAAPLRGRAAFHAPLNLDGLTLPARVWTFPAPRSYTREDVAEIHLPGSPPVITLCLEALHRAGARPAAPGEFTRRAFLHGRLDLAQAESVLALLQARSEEELRLAKRRLEGGFSREVGALAERVLDLRVRLEAEIDFSDQDLPSEEASAFRGAVERARVELAALRAGTARQEVFRADPVVALVGAPNAGKSSLFNRLALRKRALVHDEPGTTRDVVEGEAVEEGVRFRLQDTAGLREGAGELEAEAMRWTRQALDDADLVVLVVDRSQPPAAAERLVAAAAVRGEATLVVVNKCDLPAVAGAGPRGLEVSARTGAGLASLRAELARRLSSGSERGSISFLVNARHAEALARAGQALDRGAEALPRGLDLAANDLREAEDALGDILGRRTAEDLLGAIFSRFCIGK